MPKTPLCLLLIGFALLYGCVQTEEADLVIHNGNIYSIDDQFTKAEALAVKDGKILEVGAQHEILNRYNAKQTVDLRQRYVYPGFIDAHSHLLGYGIELQRLDLMGTKSFDEVIDRIRSYIEDSPSEWVLGRGWDQNDWPEQIFPDNDTLEVLFPDHFIALKRVDGHAYLASKNVVELAGIDESTQIEGGKVVLGIDGEPSGILIDAAMKKITDVIPLPSVETKKAGLKIAQENLFRSGLTSVCDAGLSIEDVQLIDQFQKEWLKLRVYAMYAASKEVMKELPNLSIQTGQLTAKSVKLYADGALGSRGAFLLQPYSDDTTNRGLLITPGDSILQWAEACYEHNLQLNVHCIGDAANRIVLDVMGSVLKSANDRRWRIEHAQVVHPDDRIKFGSFTILPSMQPTHATSDMYWAKERLGSSREAYAYALQSLKNQNGLIALGTDFPVESINPINTFYAAVVRKDQAGIPPGGYLPGEALNRKEALKGITIWAAIANFEETTRGSLEPNKFADFVVLDRDLMTCGEDAILNTNVLSTWINGEQVYTQE